MPDYSLRSYEILAEEQAKRYLKMSQQEDSELLRQMIMAVTDRIEDYCQRPIIARARTDYYDGGNQYCLVLKAYPVVTLTSIDFLDVYGASYDSIVVTQPTGEVWLTPETGVLEMKFQQFPAGTRAVKVVYTAGWTTPPRAIEMAAELILAKFWRDQQNARDEIQSVSTGGETITYGNSELPPQAKSMLDLYVLQGAGSAAGAY